MKMEHLFLSALLCCTLYSSHATVPIVAKITPEVARVREIYSSPKTMGFRILKREDRSFLVGGREKLMVINHNDPENPQIITETFQTCRTDAFFQCQQQSRFVAEELPQLISLSCHCDISGKRDCFNFIRIAESKNSGLLVCGTNALNPRCYICNVTRDADGISCPGPTEKPCMYTRTQGHGTLDGSGIAPKHWELNATSLYADGMLFLGVSKTSDKSRTSISRVSIPEDSVGWSDSASLSSLDTTSYFFRSVNEADFVGKPLIVNDRTYFFYREVAVEHINQGSMIYSRVARVCKNDAGLVGYWSSFQKARLECSIPGSHSGLDPTHFNEIQDIFVKRKGDDYHIYAIFTGLKNGPQESAVCMYKLSTINDVFDNGRFRGPESPNSIWLPKSNSDVPSPRPGLNCSNPSRRKSFFEQFPLMNQAITNFNIYDSLPGQVHRPILTASQLRFSAIVIDFTTDMDIFYIATATGSILKAYQDGTEFKAFEIFVTDDKRPLVGLELSGAGSDRHLLAISDNKIFNVPLQNCATDCRQVCEEYLRGYCHWEGNCCKKNGETSCASNPSDVHVSISPSETITACENDHVLLYCHAQVSPLCFPGEVNLEWTRDGNAPIDNMGHLITRDLLFNTLTDKLSLITVHTVIAKSSTNFTCRATMDVSGRNQTAVATTPIAIRNCITKGSLQERYRLHKHLEVENIKSKNCEPEVFACARCPQRNFWYTEL
ncbi:semaphorin-1A-like isoform X2 [Diadema antillarum]|uniref:semaphorin-1A-like isoform X2 n=1 Tax=Diadema antillarum TaxID=105358 RepID=UPI003A89206A